MSNLNGRGEWETRFSEKDDCGFITLVESEKYDLRLYNVVGLIADIQRS